MIDVKNPTELQEHILSADVALLDFWAPWCAPCRAMMPVLDALQAANPSLVIGKVNVEENPELAKAAGIRALPTLILFKNGEKHASLTGGKMLDQLQDFIGWAHQ